MSAVDTLVVGSTAVASGSLSPAQLRARYRRVFPDVWVLSGTDLTPVLRARAAWRWSGGRGVLAGWSAAAVLGLRWVPAEAGAEIVVPGRSRSSVGLQVWHRQLAPSETEVDEVTGMSVTSPLRTAYDLARRLPLVEAVSAVDALCRLGVQPPTALLDLARRHPGARGLVQLLEVVRLADPGAESPWETRLRLLLVRAGLPAPATQVCVEDPVRPFAVLDLGWDRWRVAVEFDGRHHASGAQFSRDLRRHNELLSRGWSVLRFDAATVAHHPERVVAEVRLALQRSGAVV